MEETGEKAGKDGEVNNMSRGRQGVEEEEEETWKCGQAGDRTY